MVSVSDYTPGICQTPHAAYEGVLLWSMRTWLCHLGRWGSRWGLICLSNPASAFGMWQVHCRAQRACNCILKFSNHLMWRWYIVSMPPPFLFAKTPIWSLDRKMSCTYQTLQFLLDPGQRVGVLLWMHLGGRNWCRIISLHPSSWPTPQHCKTHSG